MPNQEEVPRDGAPTVAGDLRARLLLARRALDAALDLLGAADGAAPTCGADVETGWGGTRRCGMPAVERTRGEARCKEHADG